jgi:hypothetical protein
MTLARSVLLALIGLALLAMPLTAAAREHQRLKHAYQEFDSNDYPVFVCDEDSDDFRPVPWDGSDENEDEDECEQDTFAQDTFAQRSRFAPQYLNAPVAGYYNG